MQGYEEGVDFEYVLIFNKEKTRIDGKITFLNSIEPTSIITRASSKDIITGPLGGELAHLDAAIRFPGYGEDTDSISYQTAEMLSKFT